MRAMLHLPVNHPLRNLYRTLAGLAGLYVLIFGITGLTRTWGTGFFERGRFFALGLRTNIAFSVLSVVVGAVVVVGAFIGHNVDRFINLVGGLVFLIAGMIMLGLLRTDLNLLNYTVTTSVVSFVIGLVMFTAGLYGKVAHRRTAQVEENFRHGGPDPVDHPWAFHGAPHPPKGDDPDSRRFA